MTNVLSFFALRNQKVMTAEFLIWRPILVVWLILSCFPATTRADQEQLHGLAYKAPSIPVSVSWQARTAARDISFRIYRGPTADSLQRVWEERADQGEHSYSFIDFPTTYSQVYYQIRCVDRRGREEILGTYLVMLVQLDSEARPALPPPPKCLLLVTRPVITVPVLRAAWIPIDLCHDDLCLEPPVPPPRQPRRLLA